MLLWTTIVTKLGRNVTMDGVNYKTTKNCNYWGPYLHFLSKLLITHSVFALFIQLSNKKTGHAQCPVSNHYFYACDLLNLKVYSLKVMKHLFFSSYNLYFSDSKLSLIVMVVA